MRDEERGLLDSIAEQPDVDHDRRVYADWLEDHGDGARAEFLRLQLALARLPEEHPARVPLQTRERGLLYRHEHSWALGLRHLVDGWTFRRGFVEEVKIENPPAPLTKERFDEVFAWNFVRRLSVRRHGWRLFPALVLSDGARRLEELHIANTELKPPQVRHLIECPRLERLRRLELVNCGVGPNTIQRLARSELLSRLDTLVLTDNPIGPAAVALARSQHVGGLRHLDLRRCRLDDDSALAIASAPLLGGLKSLLLTRRNLSDEAVAALLSCPHLRNLTELELSESPYDPPYSPVWSLLTQPGFPSLARLCLTGNCLSRSQLIDLISSPKLPSLRSLELHQVIITTEESSDFGPAEGPITPLALGLAEYYGGQDGLQDLLARVPAMRRVHRLALPGLVDADDENVFGALLTSTHLGNLLHLDLSRCAGLTRQALGRLLASDLGKRLTALNLSDCDLSAGEITELAEGHPHLTNLTWLSLRDNHIGTSGVRALAESPYLRNLRHLDLSNNLIDDEGAFHLAKAEHLGSPVVLNVSGNDIGTEGIAALLGAAERAFERGVTIPEV